MNVINLNLKLNFKLKNMSHTYSSDFFWWEWGGAMQACEILVP